MKIYLVGGAVRDKLLGLPVKERDWVVVGATVEQMLKLGYRQVGKEFPVFLHPKTNEEYALARMERKVQPGYTGFEFDTSPNVTLEEDLLRRDLTINAMAESAEGILVDPFHGQRDLENRVLKHVSAAFSEDPVRILRLARFSARYAYLGFTVAAETIELMRHMVAAGEVNALVAERVWKELERALQEKNPEKFFETLAESNALKILFPSIKLKDPGMHALIAATKLTSDPAIRFAALMHSAGDKKLILELCNRYKAPNAYKELATLSATHYQTALRAQQLSVDELLTLFSALDIYRREERFKEFLLVCTAIDPQHFSTNYLEKAAHAVKSVNVQAIIAEGYQGQALAEQLREKRKQALERIHE